MKYDKALIGTGLVATPALAYGSYKLLDSDEFYSRRLKRLQSLKDAIELQRHNIQLGVEGINIFNKNTK